MRRSHLFTDGTKYLAEKGECFWMMDAIASHLSEIAKDDWFVLVCVKFTKGRALMVYEDGNGLKHARHVFVCLLGRTTLGQHQLLVGINKWSFAI